MVIKQKYFIIAIFVVNFIVISCQPSKPKVLDDVIKKDIYSFSEFETLVSTTTEKCKDTTIHLGELDVIDIIKIDNTISSYSLDTNLKCKAFYNAMNAFKIREKLLKDTANWQLSIGMGLYHKKYNLYWGGLRFPRDSYYRIEGRDDDSE